MKIYVSLSLSQDSSELKTFMEGVDHLKKLGHNILYLSDLDKSKLKENSSKILNNSEKHLKNSDIVIAEVSSLDSKVGYEIARAFSEKKIVIAFEHENNKEIHAIIHGNESKNLINQKYNEKNIVQSMNKALKEAASKLDSKFILIISPEIDRYLEWAGQAKRMHKAQIVREAVEYVMSKDKDYKKYSQSGKVE